MMFAAIFPALSIRCASGQYLPEACPESELVHVMMGAGHRISTDAGVKMGNAEVKRHAETKCGQHCRIF